MLQLINLCTFLGKQIYNTRTVDLLYVCNDTKKSWNICLQLQ